MKIQTPCELHLKRCKALCLYITGSCAVELNIGRSLVVWRSFCVISWGSDSGKTVSVRRGARNVSAGGSNSLTLEDGALRGIGDACFINLGKLGLLLLMFLFYICKWMTLIFDFVNPML